MKKTTFRNSIIFSLLILFISCFMSIGFSAVQQSVQISGTITHLMKTMLVNNTDESKFLDCSNISSTAVKKLYFQTGAPSSYSAVCDVSEAQNNSVKAYLKSNGSVIVVPSNSSNKIYFNTTTRFRNLKNCSEISFGTDIINTKNLRTMRGMFENLCSATGCGGTAGMTLDLTSFDTSRVVDMESVFYNATNLKSVNLTSFDTTRVFTFGYMFYGCKKITTLNLSSFDSSNICYSSRMFAEANSLTHVYVNTNFNLTNVNNITCPDNIITSYGSWTTTSDGEGMFYLTGLRSSHDYTECQTITQTSYTHAKIDGGSSSPGCFDNVSNMP